MLSVSFKLHSCPGYYGLDPPLVRVLWSRPTSGRTHLWSGYSPIDYSVCDSSLYGSDFHQSLSESYLTDSMTSSQSELQARAHVTSSEAAVFIQDIVQDLVDAMMAPSGEEIVHDILHGIINRDLIDSGFLAAADIITSITDDVMDHIVDTPCDSANGDEISIASADTSIMLSRSCSTVYEDESENKMDDDEHSPTRLQRTSVMNTPTADVIQSSASSTASVETSQPADRSDEKNSVKRTPSVPQIRPQRGSQLSVRSVADQTPACPVAAAARGKHSAAWRRIGAKVRAMALPSKFTPPRARPGSQCKSHTADRVTVQPQARTSRRVASPDAAQPRRRQTARRTGAEQASPGASAQSLAVSDVMASHTDDEAVKMQESAQRACNSTPADVKARGSHLIDQVELDSDSDDGGGGSGGDDDDDDENTVITNTKYDQDKQEVVADDEQERNDIPAEDENSDDLTDHITDNEQERNDTPTEDENEQENSDDFTDHAHKNDVITDYDQARPAIVTQYEDKEFSDSVTSRVSGLEGITRVLDDVVTFLCGSLLCGHFPVD